MRFPFSVVGIAKSSALRTLQSAQQIVSIRPLCLVSRTSKCIIPTEISPADAFGESDHGFRGDAFRVLQRCRFEPELDSNTPPRHYFGGWVGLSNGAKALTSKMSLTLLCKLRRVVVACPLEAVVETMRPLPVEPIGDAPAFVRGVSLIRGQPTPVVDLSVLLGLGDGTDARRFVTLRSGERVFAAAFDEVLGTYALPLETLADMPGVLADAESAVSQIGTRDAEMLLLLQATRVVPDALWASIAQTGGRL